VHGALAVNLVEQEVHRGGGERGIVRVAGDVGLVDLDAGRGEAGHLGGENLAEGHGELVEAAVVVVEEGAGEHVGARDGELERAAGDRGGALAVGEQVEGAFAKLARDDAGRLAAEAHGVMAGEFLGDGAADHGRDAGHRADEILDHAVRVGVVDVEAVELAVGRQVDAGLTLEIKYDAGGIDHGLLAGQGGEPVGHGIGTDGGGEDAGLGGDFGHDEVGGRKAERRGKPARDEKE
jgi:hypothetical protein